MATTAAVDESRRRAILDTALETFLVNSVAGTSIEDIRRRSGASVGCIYHHFASKENLAAELYLEILRDYHHDFLGALRASKTAQEGIKGAVHHHFRWVAAHPERASYLFHCREPEVTAASEGSAREVNAAFYAEAGAWLAEQVDKRQIRTPPAGPVPHAVDGTEYRVRPRMAWPWTPTNGRTVRWECHRCGRGVASLALGHSPLSHPYEAQREVTSQRSNRIV